MRRGDRLALPVKEAPPGGGRWPPGRRQHSLCLYPVISFEIQRLHGVQRRRLPAPAMYAFAEGL